MCRASQLHGEGERFMTEAPCPDFRGPKGHGNNVPWTRAQINIERILMDIGHATSGFSNRAIHPSHPTEQSSGFRFWNLVIFIAYLSTPFGDMFDA